jgi:hypothetical protein
MLEERLDLQYSSIILSISPVAHQENDTDLLQDERYLDFESALVGRLLTIVGMNNAFSPLINEVTLPMGVDETTNYIAVGSQKDEEVPYILYDIFNGKYLVTSSELPVVVTQPVPDSTFLGATEELLDAIRANPDEWVLRIATLMVKSQSIDPGFSSITSREVARIVYVQREIQGIPVIGDKMAFGYHLDGRIRKISGLWTPVDYNSTQFTSYYSSTDDAIDMALDKMIEFKINPFHQDKMITLETGYQVVKDGQLRALSMVLIINAVASNGAGQFANINYAVNF